jgi:hypothetical protein
MKIRRPHEGEWIRVNSDPAYRKEVMVIKEGDDKYLVRPDIADKIDKSLLLPHMVFIVCGRSNILTSDGEEIFLWLVPVPVPETHIAYRAMGDWFYFENVN